MDLSKFISTTLVQIATGIEAAQSELKEKELDAIVNTNITKNQSGDLVTGGKRRSVEIVEFDVAVLVNEGTETNAGVGLKVASLLSLEAGGKSNNTNGSESRIKFKIPMSYPMHKYD